MSHLTTIKTKIKNLNILIICVQNLIKTGVIVAGKNILEGARISEGAQIKDFYGQTKIADLVIERKRGYDLGFVDLGVEEKEFEFISDNDAWGKHEFLAALLPLYAKESTIATLLHQGFDIESITECDSEIKIIAGKWG